MQYITLNNDVRMPAEGLGTSAGGGFAYVGAMQDSFPHCLALSRKGYNAFALIYRPGARTACEDLTRAIALIYRHEDELGVTMDGHSLWGGSAGAPRRLARCESRSSSR